MTLVVTPMSPTVKALTIEETKYHSCRIFTIANSPLMPVAFKKDAISRGVELAKFYHDNATLPNNQKIEWTAQRPVGSLMGHLAHEGVAYTPEECLEIKLHIADKIMEKEASWGIVLQDPEDMIAARDDVEAMMANA